MATTLANLRDRVELILADSGNAIWATGDIDEAIRRALHEYSKVRPLRAIGTLTAAATGHEFSTTTLTGILDVVRVWCPYTAASPEDPPEWRAFEFWRDAALLYFPDEVSAAEVMRIFFTKSQALKDLDSAAATTFPDEDESLIATGAAGYAAGSRAVDLGEQVTLDRDVPARLEQWSKARLAEFRQGLAAVAQAMALQGKSHVELPKLDRHDGAWS
jgi:hypothetical protein